MITAKDAPLAGAMKAGTAEVVAAAQARDLGRLTSAVTALDEELARATDVGVGTAREASIAYRTSVIATVLRTAVDEYGGGVVGRSLTNETEYQDAYAFTREADALWRTVAPQVRATAPADAAEVDEAFSGIRRPFPCRSSGSSRLPRRRRSWTSASSASSRRGRRPPYSSCSSARR